MRRLQLLLPILLLFTTAGAQLNSFANTSNCWSVATYVFDGSVTPISTNLTSRKHEGDIVISAQRYQKIRNDGSQSIGIRADAAAGRISFRATSVLQQQVRQEVVIAGSAGGGLLLSLYAPGPGPGIQRGRIEPIN